MQRGLSPSRSFVRSRSFIKSQKSKLTTTTKTATVVRQHFSTRSLFSSACLRHSLSRKQFQTSIYKNVLINAVVRSCSTSEPQKNGGGLMGNPLGPGNDPLSSTSHQTQFIVEEISSQLNAIPEKLLDDNKQAEYVPIGPIKTSFLERNWSIGILLSILIAAIIYCDTPERIPNNIRRNIDRGMARHNRRRKEWLAAQDKREHCEADPTNVAAEFNHLEGDHFHEYSAAVKDPVEASIVTEKAKIDHDAEH